VNAPRRVTSRDIGRIAEIERATFPDPWSERSFREIVEQRGVLALAVDDESGRLVGYGMCSLAADEGEILNLAVDQPARGCGLGRSLLRAMVAYLRGAGARSVFLEVRPTNNPAITLYEREGFRVLGTRLAYYRHPREDALTMVLTLGSCGHENDEGMREIG
jgi:ribosomal-protein-alanine N-acetyltransferase